jgi:multidrug efflux pump subunit AcrB
VPISVILVIPLGVLGAALAASMRGRSLRQLCFMPVPLR